MSLAHMTHNNETALLGKSQRERAITSWLPIFLLKRTNTGLGNGNVVRKTHCSWGGPKFRSQHLIKWLPTICKSSSRSTPSYDLHRHLHVCCVYTYSQTHTYTHKPKKMNLSKRWTNAAPSLQFALPNAMNLQGSSQLAQLAPTSTSTTLSSPLLKICVLSWNEGRILIYQ